ncbi:hypothetical protein H6G74_20505 [Nostoc spongiaeforme FACHB-130]|uniref:Uncharacterized protein n=1 Tax=Nostoc spongiaeforme FACHB-130 TaxID=1357510 RepID=A0ABR8G0G2_9NOSO|nr:hypothetical protein [Nostoc spongiaeforme]MBD2596694.1 hypothetical protein [Nostoc spongiaeforme FACHB-130]
MLLPKRSPHTMLAAEVVQWDKEFRCFILNCDAEVVCVILMCHLPASS